MLANRPPNGATDVDHSAFSGSRPQTDLFRGIANWAIFLDHIANNIVNWLTTGNDGFSDAADLLVFISGYTCNLPLYPSGVWYFNPFTWQLLFIFGAWFALDGALELRRLIRSRAVGRHCLSRFRSRRDEGGTIRSRWAAAAGGAL